MGRFGWFSRCGFALGNATGPQFWVVLGRFGSVLGQFWVSFGPFLIDTPRLAYGKFSSFGSFRVTFRSVFLDLGALVVGAYRLS